MTGPKVLDLTEFPDPEIDDNEVLNCIEACALNHLDVWVRRGLQVI
jgi:NADPH:quinone reductase-like Zn-dependent oxidoreductase